MFLLCGRLFDILVVVGFIKKIEKLSIFKYWINKSYHGTYTGTGTGTCTGTGTIFYIKKC